MGAAYARGKVLNVLVESPTYDVKGLDAVPYIDAIATTEDGKTSLFILNRDLAKAHAVELVWEEQPQNRVLDSQVLTGTDLKAANGFDAPERVKPQGFESLLPQTGAHGSKCRHSLIPLFSGRHENSGATFAQAVASPSTYTLAGAFRQGYVLVDGEFGESFYSAAGQGPFDFHPVDLWARAGPENGARIMRSKIAAATRFTSGSFQIPRLPGDYCSDGVWISALALVSVRASDCAAPHYS